MSNLTKEELIKIGVNSDNLNYPCGEMNIVVQCFGTEGDGEVIDTEISPDIYMPRRNEVSTGYSISIESEEDKEDWIKHLKDSAERLKIMSYYLTKQAEEIEKLGYPVTTCYYPE